LHKNPALSIQSWVCAHPGDVFLFPSEMNGIHVPITIGIQKPTKFHTTFQFSHNELISMDAMFGTNDVKYHLFTLMVFDFHRTWVPVAWVITSRQTCEDSVRWLNAMWAKLLSHMPHSKPLCFIVDDAP
jgi:hypothetical protein